MIDSNNPYTKMQKTFYESNYQAWSLKNTGYVVGPFNVLNNWKELNDLIVKFIDHSQNKEVLDFGCGPGRNLVLFKNSFKKIDGVDISQIALNNAKIYLKYINIDPADHKLFLSNGVDLSEISDSQYDAIMSIAAFHHICVHEIRFNLLKEFFRVLKNNGKIVLMMGFGLPNHTNHCVSYYSNYYAAYSTNSAMDTRVEHPEDIQQDLEQIGYKDFQYKIIDNLPCPPDDNWQVDHRFPQIIVFSAKVIK